MLELWNWIVCDCLLNVPAARRSLERVREILLAGSDFCGRSFFRAPLLLVRVKPNKRVSSSILLLFSSVSIYL